MCLALCVFSRDVLNLGLVVLLEYAENSILRLFVLFVLGIVHFRTGRERELLVAVAVVVHDVLTLQVQAGGKLLDKSPVCGFERRGQVKWACISLRGSASVYVLLDVVVDLFLHARDRLNAALPLHLLHDVLLLDVFVLQPAGILILVFEVPKFDMTEFIKEQRKPRQVDFTTFVDVATSFW